MARRSAAAVGPRASAGAGACTKAPLQGARDDNFFASLTDRERQHLRIIQQEAGCFECAQLVLVRGCEKFRNTVVLYKLVVEGLTGG